MKRSFFVVLAGLSAIAGATPSHSVTGIWHGHVLFDMSHLPAFKNQRQKSAFTDKLNKIQQANITLTLKGDHTYSQNVSMPGAGMERLSGRWTVNGQTIILEQMVAGRYSGSPQSFTIDKTWRTFSLKKLDNGGLNSTVTYFR